MLGLVFYEGKEKWYFSIILGLLVAID